MAYRELEFPVLYGIATNAKGEQVKWGLSEYITDVLLRNAYTTVELCDFIERAVDKLGGPGTQKRGDEQVGMKIRLTEEDHGTLCSLARKAEGAMNTENLVAFAKYNKLIFSAPTVKGELEAPKSGGKSSRDATGSKPGKGEKKGSSKVKEREPEPDEDEDEDDEDQD